MKRFGVLLWLVAACVACGEEPIYCSIDRQCSGDTFPGARCVFDGDTGKFCARPDASCASGFRWSNFARRDLADECVDPSFLTNQSGS